MKDKKAKHYSDVITFAYWIRKQSMLRYKKDFAFSDDVKMIGKGAVFHVAPSNVAVNYAYSLVTGLITGNANVVRVPSKRFEQIELINFALKESLHYYPKMADYICLIRYGHSKEINDFLSSMADVRIIWGGDNTINTLRLSPMKPRSVEIVFADRYSFAVIDSDYYSELINKDEVVMNFYNDTYLTDQNACSSPRIIVWIGDKIESSKQDFWNRVHLLVSDRYNYQQIMGIDKLLKTCIVATKIKGSKVVKTEDNYVTRMSVPSIDNDAILSCFGNSGFFLEYDANTIEEIMPLCNNSKCQTVTYIGNIKMFDSIINTGCRGVDRIVPFGSSMNFDLIWDGYDLVSSLSRLISLSK